MRLRQFAIALLAGTALVATAGTGGRAMAEDVTINLDALGPEPKKAPPKPSKPVAPDAVRSEVVPDPAPMQIGPPKPEKPKQPKLSPKPAQSVGPTPVAAKPASSGEIDFIGRTKKTQGVVEEASPQVETPKPKIATPPVMATPIPDDPAPSVVAPVAPVAVPPVSVPVATPAPAKLTPPPKKKDPAATIVIDSTGLDGDAHAAGKPKGTPLTAIQPDGVLYIPKNIEALPQPVSATPPATPNDEEEGEKPLTLPPSLPDAPAAPAAPAPATQQPSAKATPPSTQTLAAAASAKPQKPNASQDRASVLAGHATAVELKFDPGQETLTPESQAALDQIAVPLKSTGLRVQLAAYSGPPGNNSSDARRLSLKRALAVRDYLGTQGVPKLTVNIAAFGGAVQGQTDRVDLMVRTDQAARLSAGQ